MHIPDGMLETRTLATTWIASGGMLAWATRRIAAKADDSRVVLYAVLAALVFALQMLNFPVAGGTSGHFAGGAAAAIILGPWAAVLVMSTVLVVQALLFADGGVVALGANILNMAVLAPFAGWAVYSLFARVGRGRASRLAGAFVAAWLAAVVSAVSAGVMVWASGRADFALVVGAMGFWHSLIGLGEGVITAGIVGYLLSVRPDILAAEQAASRPVPRSALVGLIVAAIAAVGISFAASAYPDGLEYVAERVGFVPPEHAVTAFERSPLPDYLVPGIANQTLAGILAGVVGVIVTGLVVFAIVRGATARRNSRAGAGS